MKAMTSQEIENKFVEFFENKGHKHVSSSSLIPEGKDLLFTNAGMNQFKDIFLGLKIPSYKRAVTVQKCFRANDLDNVGKTPRHHTFFKMLGNFSFGDYFKKEAIEWAWEFLTHPDWLGIDKSRFYVTVFDTDDEALWEQIWQKDKEAIKRNKYAFIKKDKDNFWEMGSVGPCGPCSEIFYSYGDHDSQSQDSQSQDVEIWNLVFTQSDRQKDGSLKKLKGGPFIDTGAGLERLTAVMQGVESNFETDIFMDLFGYLLEEKVIVATIRAWRKGIQQPKNESEAKIQDENIRQVFDTFLKDLSDHLQLESVPKMSEDSLSRWFFMDYIGEFQNIFEGILKKLNTPNQRKALINFLCEYLQKDRTLREDTKNYKQNLLKQTINEDQKKQNRIALLKIADHARAIACLLTDGVTFPDEGRGYVARDIFKRMCKCLEKIGISIIASTRYYMPKLPASLERNYYTPCFLVNYFIKPIDISSSSEEKKQYRFIMDSIVNETIRHANKDEMKERDHQIYSNREKIKDKIKEIKQSEEKIKKLKKEIEEKKKALQKTSSQKNKDDSVLITEEEIKKTIKQNKDEIEKEEQKIKTNAGPIQKVEKEIEEKEKEQTEDLKEAKDEKIQKKENIFHKEFEKAFQNQIPSPEALGAFAFKIFETYGISKEGIKQLLQKRDIQLNEDFDKSFKDAMEKVKKASSQEYITSQEEHLKKLCRQAKASLCLFTQKHLEKLCEKIKASLSIQEHFVGYDTLSTQTQILKLSDGQQEVQQLPAGQKGFAFFKQTPFYAESGEQMADQGAVKNLSQETLAQITDCQKYENIHYHKIQIKNNILRVNDKVILQVDSERRAETKKHHTASLSIQKYFVEHFVGYDQLSAETQILKLSDGQQEVQKLPAGQEGYAIFKQTPFYAESGGQIADQGEVKNLSQETLAQIIDCQKYEDIHYHKIQIQNNILKVNDKVILQVHPERRAETKKHHTATHLLHAALKEKLGDLVTQRGSLVAEDHLRFDFTHSKPVTPQEISQIEKLINNQIAQALPVTTTIEKVEDAKAKGAVAFFAEKYPEKVRVLSIGHNKESIELCGGTHVKNTSEIQAFVITLEESIKGGIRRIKALAGQSAIKYLLEQSKKLTVAQQEAQTKKLTEWIRQSQQNNKALNKQVQKLTVAQIDIDALVAGATAIEGGQQVKAILEISDREALRQITDRIKNKLDAGIVIVMGQGEKGPLMVAVTQNLKDKYNAVIELKKYGQGGGRPDFAQGFHSVSFHSK